jgi:small-conductance mechanosensitive channel
MHQLRADARRACAPGVDRPASRRARATAPLVLAPVLIGGTAGLGVAAGLSTAAVLGLAVAVTLVGALIAHRTVASVLAGAVLLLARPFAPGDRLRVYVPELGGVTEAVLLRIGLVTTTLCTGSGVLVVANNQLLRVPPPGDTARAG